ncbi:DUF2924 domain-containing protein [Mesorhizobium sp. KR9-304]|uniref:DUF2924 domain-containing protein n=1 Tax=Mesorhizobium sp. KR9-304 TaxID=3156614 RepID=UPI0032B4C256
MSNRMLVDQEVAALGDLSREELAERWTKAYGHPPPKGARRDFLLRAAAWYLQASRLGGLSPDTHRMLRAATAQVKKQFAATQSGPSIAKLDVISIPMATPRRQLSPGTRLVREWNGRSHVVDVLEEGFAFEGRLHKSLTAIARQITGAHWSGPRFFGL